MNVFRKLKKVIFNQTTNTKVEKGTPLSYYGDYTFDNYIWHSNLDVISLYDKFGFTRPNHVKDRHFNLYNLAKLSKHLTGDTVECGVRHGFGSFIILNAIGKSNKTHHLFDSFEGLSEPEPNDVNVNAPIKWSKGDLAVDEETVQKNLKGYPIKTYKGWIPDKFHLVSDIEFSLVHIDVDLYQPTVDSLDFFYNRMQKGGIIICDDYGSTSCPGAKLACDEFFKDKAEPIIELNTCQVFIIKQ